MVATKGLLVYKLYRALSYGLSPLIHLHLRWRRFRGLEHSYRWPERLGYPSQTRPQGPLLWFHAVSLGEGMAAIPVIKECMRRRPDFKILMTTTTISAFEVITKQLPTGIIIQFAPVDTPASIHTFLEYWRPNAIMLMESELWPNLIMDASRKGITLALLNARMSEKSYKCWSYPALLPLISLMLSKFALIVPLSTQQAIRFQLLQASPSAINFSGDLKYVVEDCGISTEARDNIGELEVQLANKHVWMASSLHRGEEKIMLEVHKTLTRVQPKLLTILAPRHPKHGQQIAQKLQEEGLEVALRSKQEKVKSRTNFYVVDTLGELRHLYRLTPIAVIGGSFFPGLAGHNVSEAAAAGCAVLTGPHVGHFLHMVQEMQQYNCLSVLQVHGQSELERALMELFADVEVLEGRRIAAKEAFLVLSNKIVANVSNLLMFHVLNRLC